MLSLLFAVLVAFYFPVVAIADAAAAAAEARPPHLWHRWEQRTVDCLAGVGPEHCVLQAPNSRYLTDTSAYKCREEPMPHEPWNTLAQNSTTRIACPIGCAPDADRHDLSVLQKVPYVNPKCQKYYTYGKYRDGTEWYIWMTKPCLAVALTTHCRYTDVPQTEEDPFRTLRKN